MRAVEPVHEVLESEMHWFNTYSIHPENRLGRNGTPFDPFSLLRTTREELLGTILLLLHDSCGSGTREFLSNKEKKSKRLNWRPRTILQPREKLWFNKFNVTFAERIVFHSDLSEKLPKIKSPKTSGPDRTPDILIAVLYSTYAHLFSFGKRDVESDSSGIPKFKEDREKVLNNLN